MRIEGASVDDASTATLTPNMGALKKVFFTTMREPMTLFTRMPWTILAAQGDDVFLTSDRPVLTANMIDVDRPGFRFAALNDQDVHYVLPLTQRFALIAHLEPGGQDRGFQDAPHELVAMINEEAWRLAPRYVYAPARIDPALVRGGDDRQQP